MTTAEKPTTIEQGEFAWVEKSWGPAAYKRFPYSKSAGSNRVLQGACNDFGISMWQLARLLGLAWQQHIYSWLNGRARPSQMYMTRLTRLYQLHVAGVQIKVLHHINWDGDGSLVYKDAVNVTGNSGISTKRRTLSTAESNYRTKMAQLRLKQE